MQRIPWVSSCYPCTAWSWTGSLEWQPSTKVHSKQSCCGVCLQNTEGMLSKASLHRRHRHWAGRPYYHRCLCFAQHRKKWLTPTCRLPAPSTIRPQPCVLPQWGTIWHRVCEHFFFSQKPHESHYNAPTVVHCFFFFTCQPLCYFQSMKYGSMNSKLVSLFTSSFITYLCINTSAYVSVLKLLVMSVYMCYWNVTCNFHIIVLNQRNNQGFILIIVPEAYYTPFHTSGATLSKLVLLFALAASVTKT